MDTRKYIFSKILSDELLAPEIGGVYIHTFAKGHRMEPHNHNSVEVISVIHGSSYMVINNQYINIKKNECLIIFPNVSHSFFVKNSESCRLINVHFNPGHISEFFSMPGLQDELRFFYELQTNTMSYLRLVDNTFIRNISERIMGEVEKVSEYSEVLLRLYFSELYIRLSQIMSSTQNLLSRPVSKHISSALLFIHNFYNEKLTLQQVGEQAGISPRHLSRIFYDQLGMTVQDYISALRIRKAKDLLENSSTDITGIAQASGFGTSQYFTTCFKKFEGITPKKYREIVHDRILNRFLNTIAQN